MCQNNYSFKTSIKEFLFIKKIYKTVSNISGEKGIEFDQVDRPMSASSNSSSRPSTANSLKSQGTKESLGAKTTPPVGSNLIKEVSEEDSADAPPEPAAEELEQDSNPGPSDATAETISKDPYKLEGSPPETETKLADVVDDLPVSVLSRPGTPSQWAFDDKDTSLKTSPPRPTSATLCSPPVPRKVPISVDHHLRK